MRGLAPVEVSEGIMRRTAELRTTIPTRVLRRRSSFCVVFIVFVVFYRFASFSLFFFVVYRCVSFLSFFVFYRFASFFIVFRCFYRFASHSSFCVVVRRFSVDIIVFRRWSSLCIVFIVMRPCSSFPSF